MGLSAELTYNDLFASRLSRYKVEMALMRINAITTNIVTLHVDNQLAKHCMLQLVAVQLVP
jgi:hypothetical protein